jgi:DNA processing protein
VEPYATGADSRSSGAQGCWSLARGEPGYPEALLELERPPERLWGVGNRELLSGLEREQAVTIVGARRSGAHGRGIAARIASDVAAAGLVVVSGMAFGCDSAAHEGALSADGLTLAVLAGGPDVVYPPSKRGLYRRILAADGAIVSEHPPGTPPRRWGFPARNRIMAALSGLTLVIEGRAASGTRITAEEAMRLGREVAAVPGSVTSALAELPNELIRDGAHLVRDGQDVLDLVLGVGVATVERSGPRLEAELRPVLEAVERGATSADAVAAAAGLDGEATAVALARLELMGYVSVDAFGAINRTQLRPPG